MDREIFLVSADGKLVSMQATPYDSERLLQEILANHPALLAGSAIDPVKPRRWLLVRREAGLPSEEAGGARWSVDHLFLDQDGVPTLVEVKRSSDTRIRREVVGQMLDYAANAVVHWPVESLRSTFEARCQLEGSDPEEQVAALLQGTASTEEFWQNVKTNLQAGRIRLLFVADQIPVELRRVVEFLNTQMDPAEVLAIEIPQFVGPGVRTLVPTVLGRTAESEQRKAPGQSRPTEAWTEERFFAELATRASRPAVAAARRILDWATRRTTRIWWGRGSQSGSFVPVLSHAGTDHQLFAVWTYAALEVYFYWYQYKDPFVTEASRLEILERLNAIDGIALPADSVNKRPSIPLDLIASDARLSAVLTVFDRVIERIERSEPET